MHQSTFVLASLKLAIILSVLSELNVILFQTEVIQVVKPERPIEGHPHVDLRGGPSISGAMLARQQARVVSWPCQFMVAQNGSRDVEHHLACEFVVYYTLIIHPLIHTFTH